jgi:hypothetical protein
VNNATNPNNPTVTNDGMVSSSYTEATKVFSLNAYSPNAETNVNHFVYQPLAGNGSIVAKVQLAASSSSTAPALSNVEGKAGLMLRCFDHAQDNEASSPFVFAYVSNGKLMVEYRPSASSGQAATNQVVTLEGGVLSAATEARFLKVERHAPSRVEGKEGSVYVYESGDSLNWRQIAVVTLALTGSVNVGLVSDVINGSVQTQFGSVLVQAQEDNSNVIYEAKQTIGTEVIDGKLAGGEIIIANPELTPCTARSKFCDYGVGIYTGSLNVQSEVKLQVVKDVPTSYKGNTAIGNETAVELPFTALTLDSSRTVAVILAPTFKGAYEANISYVSAEVTISFDNGEKYSYLRDYVLGDPLFIYVGNIKGAMSEPGVTQAETIRISVLPITLTEFLNNGRGEIPSQQFTAQQSTTKKSGEYEEGTAVRDGQHIRGVGKWRLRNPSCGSGWPNGRHLSVRIRLLMPATTCGSCGQ